MSVFARKNFNDFELSATSDFNLNTEQMHKYVNKQHGGEVIQLDGIVTSSSQENNYSHNNSNNNSDVARLQGELNDLITQINTLPGSSQQHGGAKRKSHKQKSSKKHSKKTSMKKASTKKHSRKTSTKKHSRKHSRKHSKLSRTPGSPDPLAIIREFTSYIQDEIGVKGPVAISFAAHFRRIAKEQLNNTGSQQDINNLAKELFKKDKAAGKVEKLLAKVRSDIEEKRAKKRASKN